MNVTLEVAVPRPANTTDFEMKIVGGGGGACREFPRPSNLPELPTDFEQRGLRVLDLSWC